MNNKRLGVLLIIAFTLRLLMILFSPGEPHEDFASYYTHAVRLVQGNGLSMEAGPTAFRAPGYPYFLAMTFTISGISLFAAKFANVLLGTIVVLGTYLVARELFSEKIAFLAGLIVAFTPSLILYTAVLASENLATPFLLISLWLFLVGLKKNQSTPFFLGGICFAIVCLTRPGFLFLPAFLFIYLYFRYKNLVMALRFILFFIIGLIITLSPWTIRNYLVFNEFVLISTNGGFNLAIGLNEEANGTYIWNITESTLGKEFDWNAYQLKDSELTEPEVDKQLRQAAVDYVKREPVRSILLIFPKLRHFYQDDVSGVYHNIAVPSRPTPQWLWTAFRWLAQLYYMGMMLAAVFSIVLIWKSKKYWQPILIIIVILYWTGIHMVFFGADRFHLPIIPLLFILGSFTIGTVFGQTFGNITKNHKLLT